MEFWEMERAGVLQEISYSSIKLIKPTRFHSVRLNAERFVDRILLQSHHAQLVEMHGMKIKDIGELVV